ncbi:MAG: hypothetical protein HYZ28_13480 [Myxococcales bacterium]|nr:hypothetical protein [Myxococcales bacterium]
MKELDLIEDDDVTVLAEAIRVVARFGPRGIERCLPELDRDFALTLGEWAKWIGIRIGWRRAWELADHLEQGSRLLRHFLRLDD